MQTWRAGCDRATAGGGARGVSRRGRGEEDDERWTRRRSGRGALGRAGRGRGGRDGERLEQAGRPAGVRSARAARAKRWRERQRRAGENCRCSTPVRPLTNPHGRPKRGGEDRGRTSAAPPHRRSRRPPFPLLSLSLPRFAPALWGVDWARSSLYNPRLAYPRLARRSSLPLEPPATTRPRHSCSLTVEREWSRPQSAERAHDP